MSKTGALIEAAMHILEIATKMEYQMCIKGVPLNRCPDEWLEEEIKKKQGYTFMPEVRDRMNEEMFYRKSLGIKIVLIQEQKKDE